MQTSCTRGTSERYRTQRDSQRKIDTYLKVKKMINQAELLDGFICQIKNAKNALFDEFRKNYEGLPVNELNGHYRSEYQATQDALMECMQILVCESFKLKNK